MLTTHTYNLFSYTLPAIPLCFKNCENISVPLPHVYTIMFELENPVVNTLFLLCRKQHKLENAAVMSNLHIFHIKILFTIC